MRHIGEQSCDPTAHYSWEQLRTFWRNTYLHRPEGGHECVGHVAGAYMEQQDLWFFKSESTADKRPQLSHIDTNGISKGWV